MNASRVPSRRVYSSSILPQALVLPHSASIEPVRPARFRHAEFQPPSRDAFVLPLLLSRSLTAPFLSFTQYTRNLTNPNQRAAKPSSYLTVLLHGVTTKSPGRVSPTTPQLVVPSTTLQSPTPPTTLQSLTPSTTPQSPTPPTTLQSPTLQNTLQSPTSQNTLPCDLEVLKEDGRYLVSVSRMNCYFQCPYCFYLRYVASRSPPHV